MNDLQIFKNSEFGEVRTKIINNEPYFSLNDVCRILEINNPSQAKTRLNKDGVISNEVIDSMGFGRTMLSFDKESAELLINKKWTQQKDYSDRIWENKIKLISYLTNDFKTSIIRGDSFNRVVKQMSERFVNRSRADIKRIVRTEGTRINNEAMMKTFDDSKLYDEYEYVAVIDRKTSDVCKDLDGEIFKLKDREVGINFPPMHVNCRSSFSVVIPDDYVDRYEKLYGDYFGEEVVNSVDKRYNKSDKHIKLNLQLFSAKDIKNQSKKSLIKGVKSYNKRIKEHENKINNPEKYIENWSDYSDKHKQGLIKHWEKEIRNFKKSIDENLERLEEME